MTHLHIGVHTTNFVSTLRVFHSFKKVAKERDKLSREIKRLQHLLKNLKFDIIMFQNNDENVEFFTGLTHCP